MRKLFFCIALLLSICTIKAQIKIEDLLSVPFPTDLKSSNDGKQIAWVFNNQGVRNLYIADAATLSTKALTKHTLDDGIEISDIAFTPAGNKILFVEGNPNNSRGEAANPAMLQTKTDRAIWVIGADGGNLKKMGDGTNPVVSPDNKTLVFAQGSQVWSANLDSSKPAEKLIFARGSIHELRFSPDGKNLAFISNRGDHAFVGVYNIANKMLSYPDPSVDIDGAPVWSPDGNAIAFIRVPNNKDRLPFTEAREGNPWSVRLVNVVTGKAKELWKADTGKGSVLFGEIPVADNLLLWAANNQVIFPWEKDGWQHLYVLDIENGTTRLLTPGDGEVENMLLNADKTAVIY